MLNSMENKEITLITLLGLSKAFDSLDHGMLVDKLQKYGITGTSLKWLKVTCGVPQGSVLGPILFILYINEVPDILVNYCISRVLEPSNLHLYADDQQLYRSCQVYELNESLNQIESELMYINKWLIANKLKPNVGKYKFQTIGTKKQLSKINEVEQIKLNVNGKCIKPVDTAVNLCVTIYEHLSWKPYVKRLWKEGIGKLRQLKSIRECMPRETFKDLVSCVVLSKVEYGNLVYGNASKGVLDIVLKIQNAAVTTISQENLIV